MNASLSLSPRIRMPTTVRFGGGGASFGGGAFTSSVAFCRLGSNRSLSTMVATRLACCTAGGCASPRLPPRRALPPFPSPALPSPDPSPFIGGSAPRAPISTGGRERPQVRAISRPRRSAITTRTPFRMAQRPISVSRGRGPGAGSATAAPAGWSSWDERPAWSWWARLPWWRRLRSRWSPSRRLPPWWTDGTGHRRERGCSGQRRGGRSGDRRGCPGDRGCRDGAGRRDDRPGRGGGLRPVRVFGVGLGRLGFGGRPLLGLGLLPQHESRHLEGRRQRARALGARRGPTPVDLDERNGELLDRKSTRLNSSHLGISYAVFCLKKKTH